jgi:alkylation response protein AidB-like acyl-CoA dehydrogenase
MSVNEIADKTQAEPPSFGASLASPRGRTLIARMAALAQEKIAPRAAHYDRTATFPHEDFDDIFAAGLHAPTIPVEYGGLGLGPFKSDVFTLWMMTKEVARADLSVARCWEGHGNSLVLLDGLGTDEQKRRWFPGVVERGEKWVVWSGEPQAKAANETQRFGTTLEAVDGGWVLNGTKAFCTSAGGARWALLLVNPAGPGGARHASAEAAETVLLMACDLEDPSIRFDGSWWDPIGMRATVSHAVHFDKTFIPAENLVGAPGQYLRDGWQTCFVPQYASSFLGAGEAAYIYGVDFLRHQNKTDDPYVLHHVASMAMNVETMHLWLRHIATMWEEGRYAEAQAAGSRIRHLAEHLATETVDHCIRACGARVLNRPSPIERILRDLSMYVRHDNDDQVLATIGRQVLGKSFDSSFFKP